MSEYVLRSAAFDQLDPRTGYLLWQLRSSVFVVEQDCAYLDLDGRDLEPTARHVWLEHGGTPVACLRMLDDGGCARIGRVAVAGEHRGRGHARRLMQATLDLVGDRPCVLDAQSYLAGFYTRLGFVQTGPEFLDDGIPHVPMRRG
ncbi:MAG TPA: GNAT family N-acetyltransferase [Marmoricola sp.]|nr:GNAT family N-acetyltransferase [Marmoricola sp.]